MNQIYRKKWFHSNIYKDIKNELIGNAFFLPKQEYEFDIGNFYVSSTLLTNDIFTKILNLTKINQFYSEIYYIYNEYNPSVPIFSSKGSYRIRDGFENHPVIGISWEGASLIAFLVGGRLPSEAEWEICANAGNLDYLYPWGNIFPSPQLANYGEYVGNTSPVKNYPSNKYGLYDMAGNVGEWCIDWYYPKHTYLAHNKNFLMNKRLFEKTVKGGAWNKGENHLLCKSRRGKWFQIGTVSIGCRILWDDLTFKGTNRVDSYKIHYI